jgi:hypothetical protein
MTDPIHTPPQASNETMRAPPFYPWRDAYGREHPDIPRCVGETRPRNSWSKWRTWRDCQRKGVVKRGEYGGREAWFCLQHDPARRDERRVAELAPVFVDLLRQALELMPRTKRSADWLRQAEAVLAKAEGRRP